MIWTIVVICLAAVGVIFYRMLRRDTETKAEEDTGLAILEFGRAYPNEAIRQVITTADGRTVFLRLHDGKAGCMHAHGQHFTSHLIEPGTVRVEATGTGRGLAVEFLGTVFESGRFEFRSQGEAAEVSLWLLGSLLPPEGGPKGDSADDGSGR